MSNANDNDDRDLKQGTPGGANIHGIGPDGDGGPNENYEPGKHPFQLPIKVTNHVEHLAVPAGWRRDPRPPREPLQYVLDRADLRERDRLADEHRRKLQERDQARIRGAMRRRQALQTLVERVSVDVDALPAFAHSVLMEFELHLLTDDEQRGRADDNGTMIFKLVRSDWAEIEIEVGYSDAAETHSRPVAHDFAVYPRELVQLRGSENIVDLRRTAKSERYPNFGDACLAAQRHGAAMVEAADQAKAQGNEVRYS